MSSWGNKPFLKVGCMPNNMWPPENDLNLIIEGYLSYNVMLGLFSLFLLSFLFVLLYLVISSFIIISVFLYLQRFFGVYFMATHFVLFMFFCTSFVCKELALCCDFLELLSFFACYFLFWCVCFYLI